MAGYTLKCERCGKEFYSLRKRSWCTEACKKSIRRKSMSNAYIERRKHELELFGEDTSKYEEWQGRKTKKAQEIEELREMMKQEDKKRRRGCMFCHLVNSDLCGRIEFDGSLTGGTYRKKPDGRCIHE